MMPVANVSPSHELVFGLIVFVRGLWTKASKERRSKENVKTELEEMSQQKI